MTAITGPLNGIKILDFSTLLPGPYATMILADMGAEVIRVESPSRPDMLREMPPKFDERSYAHLMINRNKRALAIDLKKTESSAIIKKLVKECDLVLEQFRPGVMKKLGLDYESLKAENPTLIYCTITGYGQTGPMKDRAGHDINYLALSGLASYSGRQDTGPVLSATQIADIAGGSHHAVMAIQAALIEKSKTGKGQLLDISMSDCAFALNTLFGASALSSDINPGLGQEILNGGLFYDYYRTSDNRYLSVGGLEPQFVMGFFLAIGHPEWAQRAAEPAGKQQALKADIAAVISAKSLADWQAIFAKLDVCVEPVLSVREAAELPQFKARKMIVELELGNNHRVRQIAPPIKFQDNTDNHKVGAKLGADSLAILRESGFDEIEIKRFQKLNVVIQS